MSNDKNITEPLLGSHNHHQLDNRAATPSPAAASNTIPTKADLCDLFNPTFTENNSCFD